MGARRASWSLSEAYARWSTYAREAWLVNAADPEAIARLQAARFESLVRFAHAKSRFYARRFGRLPASRIEPRDLPPVGRHELMQAFDEAVTDPAVRRDRVLEFVSDPSRIGEPYLGRYAVWTSSGTSGEPGLFVEDPDALAVYDALASVRSLAAWRPGPPHLATEAYPSPRLALIAATEGHFAGVVTWERLRRIYPWIGASASVLPVTTPFAELCRRLERLNPVAIASYPTTLRLLAAESLAGRVRLAPAALWSGGEWCSQATRNAVREAFGCAILDDYGASEFMNLAHQCREERLHLNADWALLEPVDEKLRPVPPGAPSATVLLTNLANRVQPLIRYDLGDSVTFEREPCACGSPFPAMRVEGRRDDILRLAGGPRRRVAILPMAITTVVEEDAGVHRFQIVQTAADALELRLEKSRARGARDEERRGREVLEGFLARNGLTATHVLVRRMALAASATSGKFRQVWREEPPRS
jgi:phenylacetate-coenzyme A ligase PaaK-like adenylate-forming protein